MINNRVNCCSDNDNVFLREGGEMRFCAKIAVFIVINLFVMIFGQDVKPPKVLSGTKTEKIDASGKSLNRHNVDGSSMPQADPDFMRIIVQQPPLRIQEPIIYPDGSGTSWVICPLDPSGKAIVHWKSSPVRMIAPPVVESVFGTCYGQGALWCTVGSIATQSMELLRFDLDLPGDGWIKVGVFDGKGGIPSLVMPLKKQNRFLGISSQGLMEVNNEHPSFIGVFRNDDGKISLESCIELPFDDISNIVKGKWFNIPTPTIETTSSLNENAKNNRFWLGYADPALLTPTLKLPSVSDDFIVLGAASAGVLWILDLDTGRLRNVVNLTGLSKTDLLKISQLKHVILGTGFTPDGDLIVAARDSDLIKITVALDIDKADFYDKETKKHDLDFFRKELKEICWWRINPKTGSKQRLDSPVDFPDRMPSEIRHTAFRFLIDTYGHVKTNAFTPWSKVMDEFLAFMPKESKEAKPQEGCANSSTTSNTKSVSIDKNK